MSAKVSAAFVKAQKAFGPALKTSTNPHFRSKYADLSACVEAVIEALNNNGIALLQRNLQSEDGVTVETVFVHESGETLSSGPLHVPAAKQDPQGYGSALTYARRYSLMAACGIAPEDDDGNAAKPPPERKRTGVAQDVLDTTPALPEKRMHELADLAVQVKDDFSVYGAQAAFERIEEHGLDNVEKIYLSTLLPSDVRNPIKKYSQDLRASKKATA